MQLWVMDFSRIQRMCSGYKGDLPILRGRPFFEYGFSQMDKNVLKKKSISGDKKQYYSERGSSKLKF